MYCHGYTPVFSPRLFIVLFISNYSFPQQLMYRLSCTHHTGLLNYTVSYCQPLSTGFRTFFMHRPSVTLATQRVGFIHLICNKAAIYIWSIPELWGYKLVLMVPIWWSWVFYMWYGDALHYFLSIGMMYLWMWYSEEIMYMSIYWSPSISIGTARIYYVGGK